MTAPFQLVLLAGKHLCILHRMNGEIPGAAWFQGLKTLGRAKPGDRNQRGQLLLAVKRIPLLLTFRVGIVTLHGIEHRFTSA